MSRVARLEVRPERPTLDRLRENDGGCAAMLERGPVGGVHLPRVVAASPEPTQVVLGEVCDERLQTVVGAEEVLTDVRARLHAVLLELTVHGGVHLVDQ